MSTPALVTERLAWQQRGFNAGRYDRAKLPPKDEAARKEYLRGYRLGRREWLRAKAEGSA